MQIFPGEEQGIELDDGQDDDEAESVNVRNRKKKTPIVISLSPFFIFGLY